MTSANVYDPCQCKIHKTEQKILTSLILQYWQRESFKRPYNHLRLDRIFFENRLHHEFNSKDYKTIMEFLTKRRRIRNFRFANFHVPTKDCPDELHKQMAKQLSVRIEVELLNTDIPSIFFKYLFKEPNFSSLVVLRLNGTPINKEVARMMRYFLLWNSTLEFLDVGCCNLTERSFSIIADGVYNSESVVAFNTNRLILQNHVDSMNTGSLALIIAQLIWKHQLVELHIRNLNLNSFDIEPIAEYVGELRSTLKYLDLGANEIGSDGTETLFQAIIRSNSLIGLDISHNGIGNDGGEIIGFLLPSTKIKHLNVGHNRIDFSGMHLLISTVRKSTKLKILNICGNQFNAEIAYALKRQLEANTFLAYELDVDVCFNRETGEFFCTPQIKFPPIVGERLNRFNLLH